MNVRKLFAGMTTAALAASLVAVIPASANPYPTSSVEGLTYDQASGCVSVFKSQSEGEGDDAVTVRDENGLAVAAEDSMIDSPKDLARITGFKFTLKADDYTEDLIQDILDGDDTWIGGGIGYQDDDNNWKQVGEWTIVEGVKDFNLQPTDEKGVYTLEYNAEAPFFAKTDSYANIWIQDWSDEKNGAQFDIIDFDLTFAEVTPVGQAYIGLGADSTYLAPGETTEATEGQITWSNWTWGDETETWGSYSAISAPDFTVEDGAELFFAKAEEGRTPSGVLLTGDAPFGFGYNGTDGEWHQTDNNAGVLVPTLNEETGKYELFITDINLVTEAENEGDKTFGAKFFDPAWGWVAQDIKPVNVTWALTYEPEEVKGSWNTGSFTSDVEQSIVPVYLDEPFVVEAKFNQTMNKVWWLSPTVVFDADFPEGLTPNELLSAHIECEVNGEAYELDPSIKVDPATKEPIYLWAEQTDDHAATNTARTMGGYNEWADKFLGQAALENIQSIKYTITLSAKDYYAGAVAKGVTYNAPVTVDPTEKATLMEEANNLDFKSIQLNLSGITLEDKGLTDDATDEEKGAYWNDWCAYKVAIKHADGTVDYVAVGGAQVSWDVTVDEGDPEDENDNIVFANETVFKTDANGDITLSLPYELGDTYEVTSLGWDGFPEDPYISVDSYKLLTVAGPALPAPISNEPEESSEPTEDPSSIDESNESQDTSDDESSTPAASEADSTATSTAASSTAAATTNSSKAAAAGTNGGSNAKTGAVAFGLGAITLAGAAIAVTKKKF